MTEYELKFTKAIAHQAYLAGAVKFGTAKGYGTVESPTHRPSIAAVDAKFAAWQGLKFDPHYAPAPFPQPLAEKEGQFVVFWVELTYTGGWGCYNSCPRSYQECIEFREQIKGHPSRPLDIVRYYPTKSQTLLTNE